MKASVAPLCEGVGSPTCPIPFAILGENRMSRIVMRSARVFIFLVAVAVWSQLLAQPIYDPDKTGVSDQVWNWLNWFIVLALLVVQVVSFTRKDRVSGFDEDNLPTSERWPRTKEYLEANLHFYGALVLQVIVLHLVIIELFAAAVSPVYVGALWIVVDLLVPVVLLTCVSQLPPTASIAWITRKSSFQSAHKAR